MKKTAGIATILSVLLLTATFVYAAGQIKVEISAQEEIVVINKDGEKEIHHTPPASVEPGDVVLYTLSYHNDNTEPAESIVLTNKIPKHMRYIEDSATSNDQLTVVFSVDNGATYDRPENLFIPTKDGGERGAMTADYTHIKWHFKTPLAPQAKGALTYKAKLD